VPVDSSPEIDPNEVAFGIVVTGSITSKTIEWLNWCERVSPADNRLNLALKDIGEHIIRMARKSCQEAFEKLEMGSTISFDGPSEYPKDKGYWKPMEREEVRCALHSFLIAQRGATFPIGLKGRHRLVNLLELCL
jgi:hypothetical protein